CLTTTPTLYSCPDSLQVPEECDKCEQTTTTTCTPTTTVCAPPPEDICCGSSGPARNGSLAFTSFSPPPYKFINGTTPETCCQSCYADPNCITYSLVFSNGLCFFYGGSTVNCSIIDYISSSESAVGTVGCGFCRA
ncbi:17637_t:CDS:1, partial [Cetraspora pellucida]